MSTETLRAAALSMAGSLVAHGFRVLVLLSTHGGNQAVLENTAQELGRQYNDVVVCAPRGDVGPAPGSHSGRWLTSVMLLVRPDLVDVDAAHEDIKDEVRAASLERGRENLERFVSSIVQAVRDAT